MEQVEAHWQEAGVALIDAVEGRGSLAALAGISVEQQGKFLSTAVAQIQVGLHDSAIAIMRGLVALDATNFVFHQYLGLALEEAKKHEEAIEAYTAMLDRLESREGFDVERCEGYLLRARLHALSGRLHRAAEDLAKAQGHSEGADDQLTLMVEELGRVLGGAS